MTSGQMNLLSKLFNPHTAVENVNLEVSSSKLVAFPSGLVGRPSLVQPQGNTNESDLWTACF